MATLPDLTDDLRGDRGIRSAVVNRGVRSAQREIFVMTNQESLRGKTWQGKTWQGKTWQGKTW
ncbi:MAG: hypothetical protein WB677_16010, partial [Xanthobacteraceae bacterium]